MPKVPPKKAKVISRVLGEFFRVEPALRKGYFRVVSNRDQLAGVYRALDKAESRRWLLNRTEPR